MINKERKLQNSGSFAISTIDVTKEKSISINYKEIDFSLKACCKSNRLLQQAQDAGFTFMETIVVIAIILILSGAVGFSMIRYIDYAKTASCKNQIETFKLALQSYYLDCGMYPTQSQGLSALWEKPLLAPVPFLWKGPYLDRVVPQDPWGNNYIYRVPGENGLAFSILSLGADGVEGGEGNNEDIVSWK